MVCVRERRRSLWNSQCGCSVQWIWELFSWKVWQLDEELISHSGSKRRTVRLHGVNVSLELPIGGAVSLWALTFPPHPAPHPHHPPPHSISDTASALRHLLPSSGEDYSQFCPSLVSCWASRFCRGCGRPAPASHLHTHLPPPHPLVTLQVIQQSAVVLQLALRSVLSSCWSSPRPLASGLHRY